MRITGGLNPSLVKTELDDLFMQKFEYKAHPGHCDETDAMVFKQDTAENRAVIEEVMKPVGYWDEVTEDQGLQMDTSFSGNQITTTVIDFNKKVEIPKSYFDDEMHSHYEKIVKSFGQKAKLTKMRKAFSIYRGGFDATTTADGAYLFSDSHTTLSGDTVDNLATGALSPDTLDDSIQALYEQKDQNGDTAGNSDPYTLLVPAALFRKACQIVDSEFEYGTTDRQNEIFSSKFNIYVKQSQFLGANESGSDTAWFLLSDNHDIKRFVREDVNTSLIDWRDNKDADNYIYKGRFREVYRAIDYVGTYGSTGLA